MNSATILALLTGPAAVGVFAAIAAALPPPGATSSLGYRLAYAVVNAVALNLGHAKNASAP